MIILTLLTIIFFLLCVKMRKSHKYWKDKKVLHIRPWPFFGLVAPTLVRYKAFPWVLQEAYNAFPEQRYFGLYLFLTPYLVLRNPDLIETVATDPKLDQVCAKCLKSSQEREHWKELRTVMDNVLSSDKLKNTFELMQKCIEDFLNYFSNESIANVELKSISAKFANDVIAASVFGYSCNSLQDSNNDFYSMTKHITKFNLLRTIKLFLFKLSPGVAKFFKFNLFDNRIRQFYNDETNDVVAADLLNFFKKLQLEEWNRDAANDDVQQIIQFLSFCFKSVSTAVLFLLYELSQNPEIQEKLIHEIDNVQGHVSYESLTALEYLDMVVSETLRKWPPTIKAYLKSEKSFTIEPTLVWEETANFDAGTLCLIPVFAMHRDFKHFPNPDLFDPERFNAQNKKLIKPFACIPFGVDVRNCIGGQFAIVQIKLFLFLLLSRFRIIKIKDSKDSITLSKVRFQLVPNGKVWVGFEPRKK